MVKKITIEPITRIEGHGKITLQLNDEGQVATADFQVTQFRGFETFCQGRPFYEMPSLVERICGICPVSHALASAAACDAILGVRVPETALLLRRLLNCAEFVQSHALSFFYLSGPDLMLGLSSDPAQRNILGLLKTHPGLARDGIRLRQIGQEIIATLAGKRIHPNWVTPGGVKSALTPERRDFIRTLLPEALEITQRTLGRFKRMIESYRVEIRTFANFPSLFVALVNPEGKLEHLSGQLRVLNADGEVIKESVDPNHYAEIIAERTEPGTFLKSPYYRPMGYPDGMYRVGPAARLNVCNGCGTPLADQEWVEFRDLERGPILSSFYNHHARLIEILFAIETMQQLIDDPIAIGQQVRAQAVPNFTEGVGVVEAPRGTLIHHYRVDENGLMTWANMIVATGHNNLAMNRGVLQAARQCIDGDTVSEGALNRLEAVIRAFDPCLSCSTHTFGVPAFRVELRDANGRVLDRR
ncbi:MAG: Ni/Fe hydrogenase subunit alpha [Pseudomonadota bacterium]